MTAFTLLRNDSCLLDTEILRCFSTLNQTTVHWNLMESPFNFLAVLEYRHGSFMDATVTIFFSYLFLTKHKTTLQ